MEENVAFITETLDELSSLVKETTLRPKARLTPTKKRSWASETEDDEYVREFEEEGEGEEKFTNPMTTKSLSSKKKVQSMKVDVKVNNPTIDRRIDVERVDYWIKRVETYFTPYDYLSKERLTFATLKLSKHALAWWKTIRGHYKREVLSWK